MPRWGDVQLDSDDGEYNAQHERSDVDLDPLDTPAVNPMTMTRRHANNMMSTCRRCSLISTMLGKNAVCKTLGLDKHFEIYAFTNKIQESFVVGMPTIFQINS